MPSSTARRIAASPAAQPSLPDELLEDIFLRLDDGEDLVRAYASCFTFRRVVSGRRFLRRYHSLHPPPVLGFLAVASDGPFHPAEPPHRSAPAAAAVARAADVALAFLSDPGRWSVRDARDGRVLISREAAAVSGDAFEELIVYDPLHRRHIQICPIPGDLDSSASSANGIIFYEIRTLVFNSVTRKWRAVTSFAIIGTTATFRWLSCQGRRHYSCSCFCWTGYGRKEMLVLDTREMKFSVADLPRESYNQMHSVVDAEEGRLGLLILVGSRKLLIYSKTWPDNGDGLKDWQCDNVIPLFDRNWFFSSGGAEGYAVLKAVALYQNQIVGKKSDTQYFIVEIKTLMIKRLCSMKPGTDAPHYLYASFPPPLSLPSLRN
ncbi:hypothetical protein HU200_039755 [Digitaria exilis]|uniref:F-box domain-containing protein n=1 Tax=Digitaria exilis TaxID=1010633 RepID=A0A835B740_9POAL|nr:hypothetical protein HU200_039755 [Digitaria exilis]